MNAMRTAIAVLLVTGVVSAQGLSGLGGTVSPSNAQTGQLITLTVTAYGADQGFSTLGFSGVIREIYQGSPMGPCVWCPWGFTNPTTLTVGTSMSSDWDQTDDLGNQVPAGDYYLKVSTWGTPTFFHVRIEDPANLRPTLSELAPAQIGVPYPMAISSPATPLATYIAAASFTTNSGTTLTPSAHLSLDIQDTLFQLSFPMPNGLLFAGLQGNLDATGSTTAPAMFIPYVPQLVNVGMKWQAVVLGATGLDVTNTLSVTIQ